MDPLTAFCRSVLMPYHLAQVNIARMRASLNDPVMAEMRERINKMNHLAEQSPGFIWRLKLADAEALRQFEDYVVPFELERFFFNMSVWERVEHLEQYAFRSQHAELFRDRERWMDGFARAHSAMWWIPTGTVPTVAEAKKRLMRIDTCGPSPEAFTFRKRFPAPQ